MSYDAETIVKISEGFSEIQQGTIKDRQPAHVFAVVSWGCSATAWLAKVLNSHPEILCHHALNVWLSSLAGQERLDGWQYMRLLAWKGGHYKAVGDVHGVSRHTIPEIKEKFQDNFSAAILLREPIARLRSQLAQFERVEEGEITDIGYVDDLCERLRIHLPINNHKTRLFVHGVNMLNSIIEEREHAPVYKSEDLTESPENLRDFVSYITGNNVDAGIEWAASIIRLSPINQHNPASTELVLEEWQREIIKRLIQPEAVEAYLELGYETAGRLYEL